MPTAVDMFLSSDSHCSVSGIAMNRDPIRDMEYRKGYTLGSGVSRLVMQDRQNSEFLK